MGLGGFLKDQLGRQETHPPSSHQPPPNEQAQPPPNPPASQAGAIPAQPPPYHDWTSVPDTAELPPPPVPHHEKSPTSNSPVWDPNAAVAWYQRHPLSAPRRLTESELNDIKQGTLRMTKTPQFTGDLFSRATVSSRYGVWAGRSWSGCRDACLMSDLPLYAAQYHACHAGTAGSTIIYYEVRVLGIGRDVNGEESSLAIGYAAQPYPTWRLPGWERGSLAVHSDDGHRYVNDDEGGKDFTGPIRKGDTVGLGMTFTAPANAPPPAYDFVKGTSPQNPMFAAPTPLAQNMGVEIFFTRNGQLETSWDLHEERDQSSGGIEGLDGQYDLYAAVGVFGGVDFEVVYDKGQWAYTPTS